MGKSAHHKSENTFKFQSFNERIANVNIDVIRRIRKHDDHPEDCGTYFGEALNKWTELNCTVHFSNFRKEISDQVKTFPQLVHHEQEIVEGLKKHLQVSNSLAFEPLLDLIVQLARDLQSDFYKHFRSVFSVLVGLLNAYPQHSDLLQQTFTCLSYLFKFLWRYIIKDLKNVFGLFSTLLGSPYKDYIQNFAAESFSFLMKKEKNPGELFDFMFTALVNAPEQAAGTGRLLFEMIKGVRTQFHSCHRQVFPIILSKLGAIQVNPAGGIAELPWDLVEEAICHMMKSMAEFSTTDNLKESWDIFLEEIDRLHTVYTGKCKSVKVKAREQLTRLMRLLHVWLTHHRGNFISHPDTVAMSLQKMLRGPCLSEDGGRALLENITHLLIFTQTKLSMENIAKLVNLSYKTKYSEAMLHDFTRGLFTLPLFEKDVLPALLVYSHKLSSGKEKRSHEVKSSREVILSSLCQLILHKCPVPTTADALNTQFYMLDFSFVNPSESKRGFPQYIRECLLSADLTGALDQARLTHLWAVLICAPHVKPTEKAVITEHVGRLFREGAQAATDLNDQHIHDVLLFVLSQMMYVLIMVHTDVELFTCVHWDGIEPLVRRYPSTVHVLRLCDLYLTKASQTGHTDVLTLSMFDALFCCLAHNLSSSCPQVRLLTLRIFTQFDLDLPEVEDRMSDPVSVFQTCLKAESVPLGVHEYKQKLLFLRKLDWAIIQNSIPIGPYKQVPLRFLIGSLYNNFKLLWEPLQELITSHARGLDRDMFWQVYKEQLTAAASRAEIAIHQVHKDNAQHSPEVTSDSIAELWKIMTEKSQKLAADKVESDFHNFRVQMWKSMQGFADRCEAKSRDLVPLFLRFLEKEYYPADLSAAPTQDISASPSDCDLNSSGQITADKPPNELVPGEDEDIAIETTRKGLSKKKAILALIVHLEVFAKFTNPRSLYMEAQMCELYFQFLMNEDTHIQKVALNCLLTYRWKYLQPYRQNFERLLEEETFKEEIILFSLEEESSSIEMAHRSDLLPILFRLLYGRMKRKTGSSTSGKSNSNVRKSVIFRFLAGCRQEELHIFLDLVFGQSKHFLSDDPVKKIAEIQHNLDLTQVLPLKKFQGIVNTIDVLCNKLGHLLESYLPSLLQILIGLSAVCTSCLEKRDLVRPGAVNMLKTLRQLTIGQITQFFHEFEKYDFSSSEVDAVFTVAVWPQIEKLPLEGVYHPTALLKLLITWSRQPRFTILLSKFDMEDRSRTSLPYVLSLLLAKTIRPSVVTAIIELVDNLLSMPDFEPSADVGAIPVSPCLESVQSESGSSEPLGVRLLLPHLSALLEHIEGAVHQLASHQKQKHGQMIELRILSRVSCFVKDDQQCASLIRLLLPFLNKTSAKSQDVGLDILQSILNLIKVVSNPREFFTPLSKLFSVLETRQSRSLLCEILQAMAQNAPEFSNIADLMRQLNSWDRRRVEEPDYTLRLSAFQTINTAVKEMTVMDVDFLLPVLHNSCFFIVQVEDLSLRDNATFCMVNLVRQVAALQFDKDVFCDLISHGLLVEVKAGIKHKKEAVRHEFVGILAVMVNSFPDHLSFSDLAALTDKDVDADFFENIKHIQMHKRARALRRLIKHLQGHKMRLEFIQSYLLPLTSAFLLDEAYLKLNSLQDAAVDAMGTLCRCLPWRHYLVQLRYYLQLLPKKLQIQKLLIRVAVSVLDAFHFDLSQSEFRVSKAPEALDKHGEQQPNGEQETPLEDEPLVNDGDELNGKTNGPDLVPYSLMEKLACPPELATRVHTVIIRTILPQLHKCLTQKVSSEEQHKLARSNFAEDEEILRVPIALAMVKLLQNLPHFTLRQKLPSILIKVCHFLKSRSKDIREVSRDTLVKIAISLGPQYVPYILTEMRATLKRGYQLHVLSYTVHTILRNMMDMLSAGDLDICLHSLLEVFNEELFGRMSEEKDVEGIVGKLMEAKSSKSYDSYEMMGRLVGQQSLTKLISPLKTILDSTSSHKTSKKVQDVLRRVSQGLLDNKAISVETLMVFIYGLTSETRPLLSDSTDEVDSKEKQQQPRPGEHPQSCLLLQPAAPRGGSKPKGNKKTNIHVIVEFGLQLLNMSLKKSHLVASDLTHVQMVDPFVAVLADCLQSKHIKMRSLALRSLCWLLKFPVPSLTTCVERIANTMFVLLRNYASAGAAKGDNKELVMMCFKAVTVLVRDVKVYTLLTDQLRVLITYCEEDIHDYNRQGTAFTLLKAILSRKLIVPEIHELMGRVEKMTIVADSPHVRLQSRQLTLQYLMDYPLGSKLKKHLEFFVTQLGYELESGRESALEMLATMFSGFPQNLLMQYSGLFFLPMAAGLVNDESSKCRKLTALAIMSLLEKIDLKTRTELFSITSRWLDDAKLNHRILGAQLCGLFVEVESARFEHRLTAILPLIQKLIDPDNYPQTSDTELLEQDLDHLLFNSLNTLIKIVRECNIIRNAKWSAEFSVIWEHVESHLLYPHLWVQYGASQLFGLLFSAWSPEELASSIALPDEEGHEEYLLTDTLTKLFTIASDLCSQIQSPLLDQDLADQAIKNMVFITKTARLVSEAVMQKTTKPPENENSKEDNSTLTVRWLVKKMVREANHEMIHQPKITIKRCCVFKWVAAVSLDLGHKRLPDVLPLILPPLIRESSAKASSIDSALKTLAQEVLDVIRGVVGVEIFTQYYTTVHKVLQERRTKRKRQRAEESVSNPQVAAKRKLKKNLNKKAAKKRKIEEMRPSKRVKKRRV